MKNSIALAVALLGVCHASPATIANALPNAVDAVADGSEFCSMAQKEIRSGMYPIKKTAPLKYITGNNYVVENMPSTSTFRSLFDLQAKLINLTPVAPWNGDSKNGLLRTYNSPTTPGYFYFVSIGERKKDYGVDINLCISVVAKR